MANTLHAVLLTVHALAGTVGLVLGPVVAIRETRRLRAGGPDREPGGAGGVGAEAGTPYRGDRASRVYRDIVLVVCLSATLLVIFFRHDLWWLIAVSAFTYALVLMADRALRRRGPGWDHAYVHGRGGSLIALLTAFVVVALTVDGPLTGLASLLPWVLPTMVGTLLIGVWRRHLTRVSIPAPASSSYE